MSTTTFNRIRAKSVAMVSPYSTHLNKSFCNEVSKKLIKLYGTKNQQEVLNLFNDLILEAERSNVDMELVYAFIYTLRRLASSAGIDVKEWIMSNLASSKTIAQPKAKSPITSVALNTESITATNPEVPNTMESTMVEGTMEESESVKTLVEHSNVKDLLQCISEKLNKEISPDTKIYEVIIDILHNNLPSDVVVTGDTTFKGLYEKIKASEMIPHEEFSMKDFIKSMKDEGITFINEEDLMNSNVIDYIIKSGLSEIIDDNDTLSTILPIVKSDSTIGEILEKVSNILGDSSKTITVANTMEPTMVKGTIKEESVKSDSEPETKQESNDNSDTDELESKRKLIHKNIKFIKGKHSVTIKQMNAIIGDLINAKWFKRELKRKGCKANMNSIFLVEVDLDKYPSIDGYDCVFEVKTKNKHDPIVVYYDMDLKPSIIDGKETFTNNRTLIYKASELK